MAEIGEMYLVGAFLPPTEKERKEGHGGLVIPLDTEGGTHRGVWARDVQHAIVKGHQLLPEAYRDNDRVEVRVWSPFLR